MPVARIHGYHGAGARDGVDALAVGGRARVEALVAKRVALHVRRPDLLARLPSDTHHGTCVRRDAHSFSEERRAGIDPPTRVEGPAHATGLRAHGEEPPVRRAEVDDAVHDSRRRLDLPGRLNRPEDAPVRAVQPADGSVLRADDESWPVDGWGGGFLCANLRTPCNLACLGIECDGLPFERVHVEHSVAVARWVLDVAVESSSPQDRLGWESEVELRTAEGALRVAAEEAPAPPVARLILFRSRLRGRSECCLRDGNAAEISVEGSSRTVAGGQQYRSRQPAEHDDERGDGGEDPSEGYGHERGAGQAPLRVSVPTASAWTVKLRLRVRPRCSAPALEPGSPRRCRGRPRSTGPPRSPRRGESGRRA